MYYKPLKKITNMNTSNFKINYNFTAKFRSFLIFFAASLLIIGCEDKNQDIYIIIKNGDGIEITGDTVPVIINSVHQTLVDVAFIGSSPKYSRQIDQRSIEQLKQPEDYELVSHGINKSGSDFEKVVIATSFSDTLVHIGSIVKISVRVGTDMVEAAFYKITQ
jgi:hypothetical protein